MPPVVEVPLPYGAEASPLPPTREQTEEPGPDQVEDRIDQAVSRLLESCEQLPDALAAEVGIEELAGHKVADRLKLAQRTQALRNRLNEAAQMARQRLARLRPQRLEKTQQTTEASVLARLGDEGIRHPEEVLALAHALGAEELIHHGEYDRLIHISTLFNPESNPLGVAENLRQLGWAPVWDQLENHWDATQSLLSNQALSLQLNQLVQKPKSFRLDPALLSKPTEQEHLLLDLAKRPPINAADLASLEQVVTALGHPLDLDHNFLRWLDCAAKPGFDPLLEAAWKVAVADSRAKELAALNHLEKIGWTGASLAIATLLEHGYAPEEFGLTTEDMGKASYVIPPAKAEMAKELADEPEFIAPVCAFHQQTGLWPVDFPTLQVIKTCQEVGPQGAAVVKTALDCGYLKTADWGMRSARKILEAILSPQVVRVVSQPDFAQFDQNLKSIGWQASWEQVFLSIGGRDLPLLKAYEHEGLREAVLNLDEKDALLIKTLVNNYPVHTWSAQFDRLSTSPLAAKKMRVIEEIKDTLNLDSHFLWIHLHDEELMEGLVAPENGAALAALSRMNCLENLIINWSDGLTAILQEGSLHPLLVQVSQDFIFPPPGVKVQNIWAIRKRPELIQAIQRLNERGKEKLHPFSTDLKIIGTILDNNLFEVWEDCQGEPLLEETLLSLAAPQGNSARSLAEYFSRILEQETQTDPRHQQIIRAQIMGCSLGTKRWDILEKLAGEEGVADLHLLKEFAEQHPEGEKGRTIATLVFMRECVQGEQFGQTLGRASRSLGEYISILTRLEPTAIPEGLRTSIGLEYEITPTTAQAYETYYPAEALAKAAEEPVPEATPHPKITDPGQFRLRKDLDAVTRSAGIGVGKDGIFEVAARPTDSPYLLLLEMQLLQELGFLDLNFRQAGYRTGGRGFHLTLGGETGVSATAGLHFLQNSLVAAGWAGLNAGKDIHHASFTTSVRTKQGDQIEPVFERKGPVTELRALSIDSWEPFERTVITSYYGAMALQACDNYLLMRIFLEDIRAWRDASEQEIWQNLEKEGYLRENADIPESARRLISAWITLQIGIVTDLERHNTAFLEEETVGYENETGHWVEAEDFGGSSNYERFLGVAGGPENLEPYLEKTRLSPRDFFEKTETELHNQCTAITNLFIKSGDVTNAAAILDTTKVNGSVEEADSRARFLSVFDRYGKTRQGRYHLQGGSERMILHSIQNRLLRFVREAQGAVGVPAH